MEVSRMSTSRLCMRDSQVANDSNFRLSQIIRPSQTTMTVKLLNKATKMNTYMTDKTRDLLKIQPFHLFSQGSKLS